MGNPTGRFFLMGTGMEWYYPMGMYPLPSLHAIRLSMHTTHTTRLPLLLCQDATHAGGSGRSSSPPSLRCLVYARFPAASSLSHTPSLQRGTMPPGPAGSPLLRSSTPPLPYALFLPPNQHNSSPGQGREIFYALALFLEGGRGEVAR
jgi:hypothetical protein